MIHYGKIGSYFAVLTAVVTLAGCSSTTAKPEVSSTPSVSPAAESKKQPTSAPRDSGTTSSLDALQRGQGQPRAPEPVERQQAGGGIERPVGRIVDIALKQFRADGMRPDRGEGEGDQPRGGAIPPRGRIRCALSHRVVCKPDACRNRENNPWQEYTRWHS